MHELSTTRCWKGLAIGAALLSSVGVLPSTAQGADTPQAVSPGAAGAAVRSASSCPTFSWSGVADATGYELVLYRAGQTGSLEQVLRTDVPGDARAWTPPADVCPTIGADYAWAIRGLTAEGVTPWSEPFLFALPGTPSNEEVRQALETLRRYREDQEGDLGQGIATSRVPGSDSLTSAALSSTSTPETTSATDHPSERGPQDFAALLAARAKDEPTSPKVVTAPPSFSLNLTGDVSLGGAVFRGTTPLLHVDGGATFANTAVGLDALSSATPGFLVGSHNSALGFHALQNNTIGLGNTAAGTDALVANTEGNANTALGWLALADNTGGDGNTAVGVSALASSTTANNNTAMGVAALEKNTTGNRNTAIGAQALNANTTGNNNLASGYRALKDNTTGIWSTALGAYALSRNTTGARNTASGLGALGYNTTGGSNTASGTNALRHNTEGHYNTAIGYRALHNNVTGIGNTAVGHGAGIEWSTGSDNVAVGRGAWGESGDSGVIRIGGNGFQSEAFIEGVRGTTTGFSNAVGVMIDSAGQLGTISSSARFKEDIHDLGSLSARLADLRPVAFRYKKPFAGGGKPIQFGLIAEEVAEVFPELVVYDEAGRPETVKYHLLSTLLLNEVQRREQEATDLRQTVIGLERRLDRLAKEWSPR